MSDFKGILRLALQALIRNKVRSMLTMLGIVIGVAAVIVTVAIGSGARVSVQQSINSLGSNLIVVQPGSVTSSGARGGFGTASTLTPADGMAIAQLPSVSAVSPAVTVRAQVVASGNNWQTTVTGVAPTYSFIRSWPMASGTFFTENDVNDAAKVAVLGQTDVSQLFPNGANPIGQTILIKGVPFTVVGTLSALGQSSLGTDQDDTVLDSLYLGDATPHRPNDGQSADGLGHDIRRHRRGANRNDDAAGTTSSHRNRSTR